MLLLLLTYKNPCHHWLTRVCCHTLTKPDCLAPLQNSTVRTYFQLDSRIRNLLKPSVTSSTPRWTTLENLPAYTPPKAEDSVKLFSGFQTVTAESVHRVIFSLSPKILRTGFPSGKDLLSMCGLHCGIPDTWSTSL